MDIELDEAVEKLVDDSHGIEIGDPGGIQGGGIIAQRPAIRSSSGWLAGQLRGLLTWPLSVILLGAGREHAGQDNEHPYCEPTQPMAGS
jgi:hypothetical protein